jgi:hypothetical protein
MGTKILQILFFSKLQMKKRIILYKWIDEDTKKAPKESIF